MSKFGMTGEKYSAILHTKMTNRTNHVYINIQYIYISKMQTVFQVENCELKGTDNVQGQIYHIYVKYTNTLWPKIEANAFITLQIF